MVTLKEIRSENEYHLIHAVHFAVLQEPHYLDEEGWEMEDLSRDVQFEAVNKVQQTRGGREVKNIGFRLSDIRCVNSYGCIGIYL